MDRLKTFLNHHLNSIELGHIQRLCLLLAIHGVIWVSALALAYCVRFDFVPRDILEHQRGWFVFTLFLFSRYCGFTYCQLAEISWRHVSTRDISKVVKAHVAATICLGAFLALIGVTQFPRSVILLELVFSIAGCAGAPLCVRMLFESLQLHSPESAATQRREVLIIGAGESGHLLVKTLLAKRQLRYIPIGILDDSPNLRGRSVYGVDVIGRISELKELLEANPKVSVVILAIPSLSHTRIAEVQRNCDSLGVPLKRIQAFEDIAMTDIESHSRNVASMEAILERDDTVSNENEIRELISGKDVAVTGAGGSIGSELVRQLISFKPKSLTLVDSSEFHIFKLQRELNDRTGGVQTNYRVASIVDEARMGAIFMEHRPKILFHAAAYKHVPLMEENSYEAIQNNVIGTRNLLRSCIISGIEHFTFISTDKAVNSCSVMGHSKRLGELLVQEYTREARKKNKLFTSAIVRFGNVINSNGSVVPLFKEQILSGGPVTVTHPDMRRYFMSIREAVRLVLAASSIGREGEVFLLDMGKPVRIEDVARKMLALYGRRDIEIVYSGIRPGERLFEELTGPGEQTFTTPLQKVSRVVAPPSHHRAAVINWVTQIESRLPAMTGGQIRDAMSAFLWDESELPGKHPISA